MTSAPMRTQDARAEARALLRQWLAAGESDMLSAIDGLGARAIRDAAQASVRLERGAAHAASSEAVLRELQRLADGLAAPAPRKRSWFSTAAPETPADSATLDALAASLERERDNVARAGIALESDMAKLRLADEGLEWALELVRACVGAVEAAARELSGEQRARSAFLRDAAVARLVMREQDVLTQTAVTRQGILALQLLADGQAALSQAIDRARDTTLSALRTALAARRAVSGSQDLARQAQALERTAQAAREAPASRTAVETALDDAMAQVRRAIEAAQATTHDPRSTP